LEKDREPPAAPGSTPSLLPVVAEDILPDFPLPPDLESVLPKVGRSPAGKGQAEQWVRAFLETLGTMRRARAAFEANRAAFESNEGALAHTAGTYLLELRGHQAWEALDLKGQGALWRHVGVKERTARRLMCFARVATEKTAPLGVRRCIAGWALARALGLEGVEDLLPKGPDWKEPPEWAARLGGAPVDLENSTAERVEALLALATRPPELPASGRVQALVERRSRAIEAVARKKPALKPLTPSSFQYAGEARIRHQQPTTAEQFDALSAMYSALARV